MKPFKIIIYGQPTTKKNSATLTYGKGRRGAPIPRLLPSKAYTEYEKHCRVAISNLRQRITLPHFDEPVRIDAQYYLRDRAYYPDLLGLMQATADIISDEYSVIEHKRTLVRRWLLSDDRIIKNWDGTQIAGIDKQNPRVEITIYPLPLDIETETDPLLRKQAAAKMQSELF